LNQGGRQGGPLINEKKKSRGPHALGGGRPYGKGKPEFVELDSREEGECRKVCSKKGPLGRSIHIVKIGVFFCRRRTKRGP